MLPDVVLAADGMVVVSPDYLGLNGFGEPSGRLHPAAVPEPSGIPAIDSVRALRKWMAAGDGPAVQAEASEDVVMFAQSFGSASALWSERFAATYAPEIDFRAVALMVPFAGTRWLTNPFASTSPGSLTTLGAFLLVSHQWYRGEEPITTLFLEETRQTSRRC